MEFKSRDRRLEGGSTLRQCQLVQLYLLEVLDEICKKHRLKYCLDFGTLLGALRHNGAIPWDDDLDISMPINDFKEFCKIADEELPEGVLFQRPGKNGGMYNEVSRLRDRYSFYAEEGCCIDNPCGIFLDIYPLRRDPRWFKRLHKTLQRYYLTAWHSARIHRTSPSYTVIEMWCKLSKALAWCCILGIVKFINYLLYIGGVAGWSHPYAATSRPWQLDDSWLFPLKKHLYEGREFPIPNQAEKILEEYYGDWKVLPPPTKRNPYEKMKLILPTQAPKVWWAMPYEVS